jgi:predicted membrane protein
MVDFERRPVTLKAGFRVNICSAGNGAIGGVLLVLLGSLLFIDNLDLLPFSVASAFWPLAVLAFCAIGFVRTGNPIVRVWSVSGMVWGALLLLDTVHLIRIRDGVFWPLALITTGVTLLMFRLRWQGTTWKGFADRWVIASNTKARSTSGKLDEHVVFSGVKRRIETVAFEGGDLSCVFGSIDIDLRNASISTPDRQATVEANCAFGNIVLRVPESWRVNLKGNAVFGTYNDKTIPPRPDPGSLTPTLSVCGGTAFGEVVVRN